MPPDLPLFGVAVLSVQSLQAAAGSLFDALPLMDGTEVPDLALPQQTSLTLFWLWWSERPAHQCCTRNIQVRGLQARGNPPTGFIQLHLFFCQPAAYPIFGIQCVYSQQ